MSERIEDKVRFCGLSTCVKRKALIDSGADISLLPKKLADEVGVVYTGRELRLKDASGDEIVADEAIAAISIPKTTCSALTVVAIPKKSNEKIEILIGNDFMRRTKMQIGYQGGPNVSCAKSLRTEKE